MNGQNPGWGRARRRRRPPPPLPATADLQANIGRGHCAGALAGPSDL